MRRSLIVAVVLSVVGVFVAPAFATTGPPVPVGVGRDAKGGVCVYGFSWVPLCVDPPPASAAQPQTLSGLPPVYVSRTPDGRVCFAYGTTAPFCTPGVAPSLPAADAQQKLPFVTVINNSYAVGVLVNDADGGPVVGAVIAKDGSQACIGISYQLPFCLN